ncbi:MAG: hypothetical protein ACLUHE_03695 [Christensenellales bacterium]
MDYGGREMANHAANLSALTSRTSALLQKGVDLTFRIAPGGTHSEASWGAADSRVYEVFGVLSSFRLPFSVFHRLNPPQAATIPNVPLTKRALSPTLPPRIPKGSLFEGVQLAAHSVGSRQAKCRRSFSEAD